MAKKTPRKIPPAAVKRAAGGILILIIGYLVYAWMMHVLMHSGYFTVKKIKIDPSIQFIQEEDFSSLKGKNILTVDLAMVQRRLGVRYPQIAQIKIIKRLPDEIVVLAKKRVPFAQTRLNNRVLILDEKGVVLSASAGPEHEKLPWITGIKSGREGFSLGLPLAGEDVRTALKILKIFQAAKTFLPYHISKIDVTNLSEIYFYLSNNLKIIMDREDIEKKIELLSFMLTHNQLHVQDVKYIDLRFKEPIIGKR